VIADVLQHRAQVLHVEQQQAVVVGDLEDDREHALLRLVQVQDPTQQQRTQVRYRRANRMSHFAEDVPADGRQPGELRRLDAEELQPVGEFR
jgi:hypothetical protein